MSTLKLLFPKIARTGLLNPLRQEDYLRITCLLILLRVKSMTSVKGRLLFNQGNYQKLCMSIKQGKVLCYLLKMSFQLVIGEKI